ncbi:MAG: hypothetical protein ACJ8CR_05765 [Roseiflexaceae bacterium]
MIDRKNHRLPATSNLPRLARRSLGLFCLAIGVAGVLLPILPGWPLLLASGRLLGRRDPLLRRLLLTGRRGVRRLRQARHPLLRHAGARLLSPWRRVTRLMIG